MDFDLSEEQTLALEAWRRFLERDIRPKIEPYRDELMPKPLAHELLAMTGPFGVGTG